MKQIVISGVLLFLRVYFCDADNVIVGSTKQCSCKYSNVFQWQKFNSTSGFWEPIENIAGKYSGAYSDVFIIINFQIEDYGRFRCLTVIGGKDKYGDVIELKPELQATPGTTVTLTCTLLETSLHWFKFIDATHLVTIGNNDKYSDSTTHSLKIKSVDESDNGVYFCRSTNNKKGPDITLSLSSMTAVAGGWSSWTTVVACSVTCGTGQQTLRRFCNNPAPANGGAVCQGYEYDYPSCTLATCAVAGGWSSWTTVVACSVTCGTGQHTLRRFCNNPAPANGGAWCQGYEYDYPSCTLGTCAVAGGWSSWTTVVACSVTCGTGQQTLRRFCNNPVPANGGAWCQGLEYDYPSCTLVTCAVAGGWSSWTTVVACSVTCGNGQQTLRRFCNNPAPANGGAECQGLEYDYPSCTLATCAVNGGWSTWDQWAGCTVTCGTGQQSRSRSCNDPPPANNGARCLGDDNEYISCTSSCAESNSKDKVAPIAGGVAGGIIVLVVMLVIGFVYIRRKRHKNKDDRISCENQGLQIIDRTVSLRHGGDCQEGMYINISRASRQSSSDTDDFTSSRASTKENTADEGNTYYNNGDTLTTVKIEELKEYIKRKEVNEGLHSEYKTIPYGPQHPTTIAQKKENMSKNRYKTTFPYDHTRVILQAVPGSPHMEYINANFVDGFEKDSCYIASQGPLKHTFTDFWTMIWQNNTRKIVMLTNLIEVNKVKCDKYWPEGGKPMVTGNLTLTLESEKERAAYVTREISVEDKKTKEKRNIIQYHFTAWPDHGTPDPLYLVLFYKHVISDHSDVESGKLLVHCSAGIGRTGTYIGLDALYEEGRVTGCVDIVKFVKKMRYSRMNMVQTPDQYVCLHCALLEAFTMKDTKIGKDEFGTIWRDIQSDKQPINHQKLYKEFKMLESKKSEHGKSEYTAAVSPENIEKNRNKSVLPSDNNRLFLTTYDKGRTDYINAVQAPSYTQFVGFLTTQLPLPDTKMDFWTMIRDHNSSTVVMFINEQTEAEFVYATSEDTFSCGSFTMKITKREKVEFDILSCTIVLSRKDEKSREIVIYCAVCSGYPKPSVLCKLVNMISTRVSMSHDTVTVVSGDGAKNCGLFCTFANAISSMTIDDNADIFQLARLLQLRRPEFFADFDEYRLCYEALNFYLESTNVYANF